MRPRLIIKFIASGIRFCAHSVQYEEQRKIKSRQNWRNCTKFLWRDNIPTTHIGGRGGKESHLSLYKDVVWFSKEVRKCSSTSSHNKSSVLVSSLQKWKAISNNDEERHLKLVIFTTEPMRARWWNEATPFIYLKHFYPALQSQKVPWVA